MSNKKAVVVACLVFLGGVVYSYDNHIREASTITGVPSAIISAVIQVESGGNPRAISTNRNGSSDVGLMQLNSRYLKYYQDRFWDGDAFDPWDPEHNVKTGAAYLAHLHQVFGNWFDALSAYNGGPTRVLQNRVPESSMRYAEAVLRIASLAVDSAF